MQIDLGNFCLLTAWCTCLWSIAVGFYGAISKNQAATRSAGLAVHWTAVLSCLSLVMLAIAFVNHDYRYLYVWQHSNNAMHPAYLVSAIWGGMDGSMLLWAGFMAVFCSLALYRTKQHRALSTWVIPVFGIATGFFLGVVTLLTNPFRLVPGTPQLLDGNGLNPLLQNPSMIIHPPMLYIGFTGFVIPFAFSMAALLSGNLSDSWIKITRRWTLLSWTFLTAGIVLGGNWAYIELGWGGFWAWDPVENSSFLPWLTATAYLHSVMVQEQRGMLKVWNVSLSVATYGLTVFGTFLTRSGIVQSVHAFAATDVGWVFLAYLAGLLVASIALIAWRFSELKPDNHIQSYLSKEAAFLFNNLLLLGICFATLWGVMFPVISEAIAGEKSVVGPPFFNTVNNPLFLALLFFMGVGPVIAWRRASVKQIVRLFYRPFISGSIITVIFLWVDPSRILTAVSFGLSLFVIATIEAEFRRGLKAQKLSGGTASVARLFKRKTRRYGGFLVHLGVAVMAIGITAATAYKIERDVTLRIGEKTEIGRFTLELEKLEEKIESNYDAVYATINVSYTEGGKKLGVLYPERRAYRKSGEVTTEVEILMSLRDDLYVALAGIDSSSNPQGKLNEFPVLFKLFVNPLQIWVWFGGLVMLLGSIVVLVPSFEHSVSRERAASQQRAATENS